MSCISVANKEWPTIETYNDLKIIPCRMCLPLHQYYVCGHVKQMVRELIVEVDVESGNFYVFVVEDLIESEHHTN